MERLKQKALLVRRRFPVENAIPPEELGADIRAEIGPRRPLGILRRLHRVRADVAERTRHRHAVWLHQVALLVIGLIAVITFGVPGSARLLVEVRVGEESQSDDAGGFAVVRADGHGLAASANLNTLILLLVLEGIGLALRIAHVEPQPVAIRIRARGFREAWLVHET